MKTNNKSKSFSDHLSEEILEIVAKDSKISTKIKALDDLETEVSIKVGLAKAALLKDKIYCNRCKEYHDKSEYEFCEVIKELETLNPTYTSACPSYFGPRKFIKATVGTCPKGHHFVYGSQEFIKERKWYEEYNTGV